jgi:hypothetical protein
MRLARAREEPAFPRCRGRHRRDGLLIGHPKMFDLITMGAYQDPQGAWLPSVTY